MSAPKSPWGAAQFQALMDAAVDGIVLIDASGLIEAFNHAAEKLFGYSASEVIGRNVSVLMPEPYRSEHDGYLQRYLATGERHIIGIGREAAAQRKDGTIFPIELSVGEAKSDDASRFVGLIRDITERKRAAERLLEEEQRLAQVGRLGVLGEMAAGIAHEINQPLTAIATYAQAGRRLLSNAACDKNDLIEALDEIDRQALRAGEVIRRLRALIKTGEGDRKTLALGDVLSEALQLSQLDARAHDARIELQVDSGLPEVAVDVIQIQQVLLNLVRNALEAMTHTPVSSRVVTIRAAAVSGDEIRVDVSDCGEGLSQEVKERLFTPFFTTKPQGMGIGLSLCRSIVTAHAGEMRCEPNPAGGATFGFTLPAASGDQQPS
ncbi:MAG: two-component system sensor histidine kinase NtrB [Gammaproteobacteria bacterium]